MSRLTKAATDAVFRGVNKCDAATGERFSSKDILRAVNRYATLEGLPRPTMAYPSTTYKEDAVAGAGLASVLDHTLLKATATRAEILKVCAEAKQFGFASVCVNPFWVRLVRETLAGSGVKTCTVIGFPLGATTTATKVAEAAEAVRNGAEELDMVQNIGALLGGEYDAVAGDIAAVVETAGAGDAIVKVILETAYLDQAAKERACEIAVAAGAAFLKTSTGFGPAGATEDDVRLMRRIAGPHIGVKASGGIRTAEDARRMLAAGANRLGTSASVAIATAIAGTPAPASY